MITGGAGFLGSHLCDLFIQKGWDVLCIDNFITGTRSNISHLLSNPRFSFTEHDVTRYIEVSGPVDAVLHFASPASPPDYLKAPIQTMKVGSLGTHNALGSRAAQEGQISSGLHIGVLRRPDREPAAGNILGKRQLRGAAQRVRRSETILRGHHHGLSPLSRGGYAHRAHIQYLRAANAP